MTARPNQPAPGPLPEVPGHRVLRVVGEGGMSTIYLGLQLSLGREVAIKVMRPEALADEVGRRRFENEARTIARLEHPHIVGIHEVGRTADGLPWYSMPWLPRGHVGQRDQHLTRAVRGSCARCCRRWPTPTPAAWSTTTSRPRTCCSTKPTGRCWPTSASPCAATTAPVSR